MSAGRPMTPPDELVWPLRSPTFHLVCSASASTRAGGVEDAWTRSIGELLSMHCSRQKGGVSPQSEAICARWTRLRRPRWSVPRLPIGQVMIAKIRWHDLPHIRRSRLLYEIGAELGSPLLEFGQLGPQPPDLAVDARQLGPGLLFADVTVAVPGPGEGLDLAAEQSEPRVPVHVRLAVLQRARVDRVVDLVLGQPELLAGGLVAQRRALALPFVVRIGHG